MTTTSLTYHEVTWTDIVLPVAEEIQALGHRYPNFHPLNLQDCLTELEYPKLDHHDHYLFLVVQMPYWDMKTSMSHPSEVDIFIAHNTLVTSHRGELRVLMDMYETVQQDEAKREQWMGQGSSPLLYHLLNNLVDSCFPIVHRVQSNLRHIEGNLFNNDTRHLLHEIALLRRDIIVLRSIFQAQQGTIEELIRGNWPFIQEHLDPYWGDISDHLTQLCALMEMYAQVIDGLSDTVDTLASHRIDDVVRVLTVTTILTLPVTLLATVFGMNVVMPFSDHPGLFFSIILIGIIFTIGLVWYLKTKHWL